MEDMIRVSEYPASISDLHLNAILKDPDKFKC